MQEFNELAENVSNLVKSESPAFNSILKDIGMYVLISGGFKQAYKMYGKQLGIESLANITKEIFVSDERVTNVMAVRPELIKTRSMLKTDFSLILADSLGIGRNKSQEIIDSLLQCGAFIMVPNIMDTNAKLIRPAKLSDEQLLSMFHRIIEVNGTTYSVEEFEKFKESK